MFKTKNIFVTSLLIFLFLVTSCSDDTSLSNSISLKTDKLWVTNSITSTNTVIEKEDIVVNLSKSEVVKITLDWDSITSNWQGLSINWSSIIISKWWNYEINWTLTNWQIIVDNDDDETVNLILNWVNITNSSTSPIYVKNSKQTVITLSDGTKNVITDGDTYVFEDAQTDEPNATIFSKDELIIQWEWNLTVNANYNDGISSKDNLLISSWNITISAVDDWIRWKDYLVIAWWTIKISSEGDSLKSDNEEEWLIEINWWNIEISSWDDALHAEIALEINDWKILVTKAYEGLESKTITINGWDINVTTSDDWINVAWWNDWSGNMWPWKTWGWISETSSNYSLNINWWTIKVNAQWDWLDANWAIIMTWWDVYVDWPTNNWNWALDYDSWFNISWWSIIALWSSWMAMNIWSASTQYWVLIWLDSSVTAWTEFSIKDSSWNIIMTYSSEKAYQSITYSSSGLKNWETYTYYLWTTQTWTFTISNITTSVWTVSWMWGWWMKWWMWGTWTWTRPTRWDFWWTPPQ